MKVIVQTAALAEALGLAGAVVAQRTPKPVLQCVKLTAEKDLLTVLATDLEVGCRYNVTAVKVEEPGEALLPADRLASIVRESAGDESLTLSTDKSACVVQGAGSRWEVPGFDPAEYPAIADFDDKPDIQVSAIELVGMIGKTLFATAKAHSHYAISGVLMEAAGKKFQLVATDGHRLAQVKTGLSKSVAGDISAIVPAKLMAMIQRTSFGQEETLELAIRDGKILVRSARAVLVSSLVQGNFPKYADVIPKDTNRKAALKTLDFEHRIRQAAVMTNEESRGIKLSFKADKVNISSRTPEAGRAEATCAAKLEGEPVEIAFNPTFLLDALKVCSGDEINFEMNASNKPAVVRAGADFLYVLMPVDLG